MRHPRILNGSAQATEPQGFEEGTVPSVGASGAEPRACSLEQQASQPFLDVRIDLAECHRRVARAKVVAPAAEDAIQIRDNTAEVLMAPTARGQFPHTSPHPHHRTLRWTPVQVEDAAMRPLPDGTAHALAQMTTEKVEALAAAREIDCSRLLPMELES